MSDWKQFLADLGGGLATTRDSVADSPKATAKPFETAKSKPGEVMVCFVNRYLEGMDNVQYKIRHGLDTREGRTTDKRYCVTLKPATLKPIEIEVWSRRANAFKRLDDVMPETGNPKLVRKIMRTYKVEGKTDKHPAGTPIIAPPQKPAPAPAPGPSPTDKQGVKPTSAKDESGLPQTQVERPVPDKITKEQLKKIFVKAKDDYLQQIADELNKDLAKFKLDTPVRRAHFFGQTRQETGPGAKGDAESLNHSSQGLINTFSYYQKHRDEARQDGRQDLPNKRGPALTQAQQIVIANKAYGTGKQADRLGNTIRGDGWTYRGRGLKQTTGRRNYENLSVSHKKYWGEEINFIANTNLVAQFPYSVRSAVAFWLKNECWKAADKGINDAAIDAVTKIVNSGEINKHQAGDYKPQANPVFNRRKYVYLSYAAFT